MRENDSILIFGAGLNQLTLINAAKELGIISVVLDVNEYPPGKNISDFFYCVPGNDYETTKEIALKHKVRGIVTGQMEKPMRLMARLAQELGFIFHTPEVTEKSLDKWLMKQAFIEHNVPCAKGRLLESEKKITQEDLKDFQFPLIIKPKAATSSQGVFKIYKFSEIEKYRPLMESFSKNDNIIVEEFLDGPEYSVETITYRGKTTIVQFTEKFITPFPSTVELGHLQPAPISQKEKEEIGNVVFAAIKVIGVDNSATHAEVIFTESGPKIIEIGARLGGDYISSYLVLHSCGVNMDKAAIQVALGIEPELKTTLNQYSYTKYFVLPVGKIVRGIDDWKTILINPDIIFANLNVKIGDTIPEVTESAKRSGFVIVKGTSRDKVISIGNEAIEFIKSKIILN